MSYAWYGIGEYGISSYGDAPQFISASEAIPWSGNVVTIPRPAELQPGDFLVVTTLTVALDPMTYDSPDLTMVSFVGSGFDSIVWTKIVTGDEPDFTVTAAGGTVAFGNAFALVYRGIASHIPTVNTSVLNGSAVTDVTYGPLDPPNAFALNLLIAVPILTVTYEDTTPVMDPRVADSSGSMFIWDEFAIESDAWSRMTTSDPATSSLGHLLSFPLVPPPVPTISSVTAAGTGRGAVAVSARLWLANQNRTKMRDITEYLRAGGSGKIEHSDSTEPKTTLSLSLSAASGLRAWSDWLIPELTITWADGRTETRDMGHYQVIPGPDEHNSAETIRNIVAMDASYRLKLATYKNGRSFPAGMSYVDAAIEVAISAGFTTDRISIPPTSLVLQSKIVFRPGQDKLGAMNKFLNDAAYYTVTADLDGILVSKPWTSLQQETPRSIYTNDDLVAEPVMDEPDMTRFGNVATVRRIQPGKPTIYATATNDNPGSPASTVSLAGGPDAGYRVEVPIGPIDDPDLPDAATALIRAKQLLAEGQTYYRRLTLKTIPSTDLGFHDVVGLMITNGQGDVATGNYYRRGWSMGFRANDAMITHTLGAVQDYVE